MNLEGILPSNFMQIMKSNEKLVSDSITFIKKYADCVALDILFS